MSFYDPPTAYRLVPFWFWNDDLDQQEIVRQIQQMAAQGVGGFFICARQGLTVPYLSVQWFQFVAVAIEEAQRYGLHVWLYDEYPYPSGMSGGEVTLRHPDARYCQLLHYGVTVSGQRTLSYDLPWAKVLCARAIPLEEACGAMLWSHAVDLTACIGSMPTEEVFQPTGLTAYTSKRYFTAKLQKRLLWDVPSGRWAIMLLLEKELDDFKYFGTYVDPCHKAAMQTFIATTHEQYALRFQQHFGTTIRGLFTDEVGLPGHIPWSAQLPAFFRAHYGYDLIDVLPALFYARESAHSTTAWNNGWPASSPQRVWNGPMIKYQFFQSLHRLLNESYHQPVSAWCEKHHLQYTTEVQSMRMTTQLYSHVPGGDSAHEKVGRSLAWILDHNATSLRADPKVVSSLARQLGAERAMIECFHSVGWSMTLQDARWMLDRLAALGINFFVFHAFFYSISGLRKHDAPPSQFLQNPYWAHFRHLADYAARLAYAMSQGRAATTIAVVHPATSFWTHMGNPFHDFQYCGCDAAEERALAQLKRDWAYLCNQLLLHQIDYDHLDPELLARTTIEDRQLVIGQARYRLLILPPMTNLETAAWSQIKAFLQAGGIVISAGLLPYEDIDATPLIEAEALACFGLAVSPRQHYWLTTTTSPGEVEADEACSSSPDKDELPWTKGQHAAYFIPTPGGVQHPRTIERLLALLQQCLDPMVSWEPLQGERDSFLVHQRCLPDGSQLIFITHQEGTEKKLYMHLATCPAGQTITYLDLTSGTTKTVPLTKTAHGYTLLLTFAPYESHLLHYRPSPASTNATSETTVASSEDQPVNQPASMVEWSLESFSGSPNSSTQEQPWQLALDAGQPWQLAAPQNNILRFARFRFALDQNAADASLRYDAEQSELAWPWVEVRPIINQLAELAAGQALPMQFKQPFGVPVRGSLAYPLHCWYQTTFSVSEMPVACRLVMDKDAIGGKYVLYLNGHKITVQDFVPMALYGYPQQACEVQPWLRSGTNYLVVYVEAQSDADGVRDPLYLSGPFGLFFDDYGVPTIGKAPQTGRLTGGVQEGYPYFTGILSFTRDISIEEVPASIKTCELVVRGGNSHMHDCVEMLVNNHSLGVCCWSPYRWRVESTVLHAGINRVEIRMTNTLDTMLEGTYFDYQAHQITSVTSKKSGKDNVF